MAIITVIGAGQMGSAMAFPACANGHTVRLVGSPLDGEVIAHGLKTHEHLNLRRREDDQGVRYPFVMPEGATFHYVEEMDACIKGADLIICGVSSLGVDWFCETVLPKIPEETPLLAITKGMIDDGKNEGNLISYPEYMMRHTDKKLKINAVGGPCTAYEMAGKDPTEVTFCGPDVNQLRWLRDLFQTDFYHVSLTTDVHGLECSVALKNAYAQAIAFSIGLSYREEGRELEHYNSQAALFGQASKELYNLLDLWGGNAKENAFVGIGDMYVTVFGGRTRKIGMLLGQGKTLEEASEILSGVTLESIVIARRTVTALKQKIARGEAKAEDYPMILHVGEVLMENARVNIPWRAFTTEQIK